jgi:hypothetical protein
MLFMWCPLTIGKVTTARNLRQLPAVEAVPGGCQFYKKVPPIRVVLLHGGEIEQFTLEVREGRVG